MSVDQLPKRSAAPRGDTKLVHYDEYIDRQVESTRRVVKIVDLATSLVVLAAGVLAFLLMAAVVEHWIVPGGFPTVMRYALFALLAGSAGYFAFRRLWPLVISKVNPIYAAHAIEVSASTGPSLKNSLVNLLLFRQKRSEISDAVYHTLEEQAAVRLSRVPLDAAVDRSLLIRFGYVLVAIVAIVALYKVFSPKDPVVAAQRVLMPWADIVPASRVSISDVKPGVATVARGEFVDVSAEVRGIGDDDTVVLRYTTADGQAVDKSVAMKLSGGHMQFEGRLPSEKNSGGESGLAQSITYRIEAGDARSLDYAVMVVEAPSILVERIEYDYPEYTGLVDHGVEKLGDIRAIEGTRVTIHGRANGPIKEAHVDFDADGRRDVAMKALEADASATFLLALREDRQTPEHASYVLRFANQEGRPNRSPVKHSIQVEPDYSPEAAIVKPQEKSRDVRLDETITIEVTAGDPDFGLADVRLRGQVSGVDVVNELLLPPGHKGRLAARYQFTPSKHGLKAGDVVQYWVAANDHRTPTPNSAESQKQLFRIVSPDAAQQPPPDRIAQRDPPQQGERGEGESQQGDQQPQNGEDGEGDQQGEQQQGGAGEQGQPDENQQPQQGEGGQGEEQGQEGQSKGGGGTSRDGEGDADSGDAPQNGGENAQAGEEQGQGENQQPQQGQGKNGGEQGQKGQSQGGGGASRDGKGSAEPGKAPQNGGEDAPARGEKQGQGGQNAEPSAVSSDGDNDGEAFDRIQEHMQRKGEMKDGEAKAEGGAEERQEGKEGQGDKETGRQGDSAAEGMQKEDAAAGEKPANEGSADGEKQSGDKAGERGEESTAESKGGDPQSAQGSKEQPGGKDEQTKSPGGQETSTQGESGAGEEQQGQGAPNSDPTTKPTEKPEQTPSQGEQSDKQEPPAGGRGKKQSDSQGEQGGDRSGGGEEGGGQKAPRDGTGSAGQNQSADEGAGESSEQGTGDNSSNAGQDAVAGKETGQSGGETKGRGSKTREAPGGEEEVGEQDGGEDARGEEGPLRREVPREERQGEGEKGRGGEKGETPKDGADGKSGDPQDGGEDGKQNAGDSANQSGAPDGSGGVKGTTLAPPQSVGTAPEGDDEANLEYARKQTDLVLDKLSNQLDQKQVDKDLLKQLGWSEDDLRKFVARWKERKMAAERGDPSGEAAKRELDEALRSLGLRRGALKPGAVKDDTMRNLREGYRGPVPLEYQERLRAYNQGVSRARPEGE